jgi:predicted lipid-binding transport protein (Tim44 family)
MSIRPPAGPSPAPTEAIGVSAPDPPPYADGMEKVVVYTSNRGRPTPQGRPTPSRGFVGSLALGVASVIGIILFVGILVVIVGIFLVAVLAALVALAVNHLMMVISPHYRDRRVVQGAFRPTTKVVETTARVIDSAKPRRRD